MNTPTLRIIEAWTHATLNAVALLNVHARCVGTADPDVYDVVEESMQQLLNAFVRLPDAKGEHHDE